MPEYRHGDGDSERSYPETSLNVPKKPEIEDGAERGAYGPAIEVLKRVINENREDHYKLTFKADSKCLRVIASYELTSKERAMAIRYLKGDELSADAYTDFDTPIGKHTIEMRRQLLRAGFDVEFSKGSRAELEYQSGLIDSDDKDFLVYSDDSESNNTDPNEVRSLEIGFNVLNRSETIPEDLKKRIERYNIKNKEWEIGRVTHLIEIPVTYGYYAGRAKIAYIEMEVTNPDRFDAIALEFLEYSYSTITLNDGSTIESSSTLNHSHNDDSVVGSIRHKDRDGKLILEDSKTLGGGWEEFDKTLERVKKLIKKTGIKSAFAGTESGRFIELDGEKMIYTVDALNNPSSQFLGAYAFSDAGLQEPLLRLSGSDENE